MSAAERVQSERIETLGTAPNNHWIELQNSFDTGWRLDGASLHVPGNGAMNLYFVADAGRRLIFQFSSHTSELVGSLAAGLWVLFVFALLLILRRRSFAGSRVDVPLPGRITPAGSIAGTIALAGFSLFGLGSVTYLVGWLGLSSVAPQLVGLLGGLARLDLYVASDLYIAIGMVLLGISMLFRVARPASDGPRDNE
jgi:hypothetical protein